MTDEERYTFDLQGFLVRRGVLGHDELTAIHAEIDAQGYPAPDDTISGQRFSGYLGALSAPLMTSLMDHESVLDVVLEVNGPNARLDHTYGIYMAPQTKGLWVHGGGTPFDPAQYYEVKQGRIHCGLIGVQWALVDHPAGGGGFCCVPGSHKANFVRPQTIDYGHPLIAEVLLRAGDVVFFTEAITHGTMAWTQSYQRRALFFKYSPGNSAYNSGLPIAPERLTRLTERQQALCKVPSVANHRPIPTGDPERD
jgi:Phytanoyl-CoA dioxygenase (PhyH)